MTNLSEIMQKQFDRKECPFISECTTEITSEFFRKVCRTPQYINCIHFARRVDELKRPFIWLQKEMAPMEPPSPETLES